jgi:hypothetical protein
MLWFTAGLYVFSAQVFLGIFFGIELVGIVIVVIVDTVQKNVGGE